MIKDGFVYFSILVLFMGIIVMLPKLCKGKGAQKFFGIIPPVVIIYVGFMLLCSVKLWDLESTSGLYSSMKNPILYAMVFLMLLRCDMKKIVRLGPRMLVAFFCASISIGIGFVLSYVVMHSFLGAEAWRPLGALCGSWMGGTGNMLAIQAALHVDEGNMVYALIMDTICCNIYIPFLLWALTRNEAFNRWTKSDTHLIDEVGESLRKATEANKKPLVWQNLAFLLGLGFAVSALAQYVGVYLNSMIPFFDKATWTVLFVTVLGTALAVTPLGSMKGIEELSNLLLYMVIALIASRADLGGVTNGHLWLLTGFITMAIHVLVMVVLAKLLRLDIFTCAVASVANIGGTATTPVIAGSYNDALVPVGIVMALLGYVIGTGGGLVVANAMSIFG